MAERKLATVVDEPDLKVDLLVDDPIEGGVELGEPPLREPFFPQANPLEAIVVRSWRLRTNGGVEVAEIRLWRPQAVALMQALFDLFRPPQPPASLSATAQ